jgi:hypothetical protein
VNQNQKKIWGRMRRLAREGNSFIDVQDFLWFIFLEMKDEQKDTETVVVGCDE